jgi:hypothetical protein
MDRKQKEKGWKQEMTLEGKQEMGERRKVEAHGQEAEGKRREAREEI